MSIPVPQTQQRAALDNNQRRVAQSLAVLVENLSAFYEYISTFPDGALEAPPYEYTPEEVQDLLIFGLRGAAYADIFNAGGTLSAQDAATLRGITHKTSGSLVLVNQGT